MDNAPRLIQAIKWEMGVVSAFDPERGLILFHKDDEMIDYINASLVLSVPKSESIELTGTQSNGQMCHMYQLDRDHFEFANVIARVEALFARLHR